MKNCALKIDIELKVAKSEHKLNIYKNKEISIILIIKSCMICHLILG
jgi:hypothetical protein